MMTSARHTSTKFASLSFRGPLERYSYRRGRNRREPAVAAQICGEDQSRNFCLVDLVGIEPTTSSMPWKRAPSCATGPLRTYELRRETSLTTDFIVPQLSAIVKPGPRHFEKSAELQYPDRGAFQR